MPRQNIKGLFLHPRWTDDSEIICFDPVTVDVVAMLDGRVGYTIGGVRGSARQPPIPVRPLNRHERDDVIARISSGDTIGAIRRLRERTGADLASAHSAVLRLRDDLNPRLMDGGGDRSV